MVEDNGMKAKTRQPVTALDVPEDKFLRAQIRAAVETYFLERNEMPPVTYEALEGFASSLVKSENWEERYHAFIMVCCGNAIWRPVVSATPFDRRIFLLPQCLRNAALCEARQDELGLLCSECGNCSISGLLRAAEDLGYVALVTEGTTITSRLIESGKVDAVIGVGCMEVLQRMFAAVSKYSIPSIGIPLLTSGCVDTTADTEWIKQEVANFREDKSVRLFNLNHLRNKTRSIFEEARIVQVLGAASSKTETIAFEALLSGGQRLRPFLLALAYEAFAEEPDPTVLSMLAVAVECFHKASLIHDDIEDNDDTRYGKATVHARYGIAVAINTGDHLIGEGYRLIAETTLPSELIREGIRIVSRGHRSLTLGQGAELISIRSNQILPVAEMLDLFDKKTAAALKVSLLLGAKAGGADDETIAILESYCHFLGIAYQIQDDLSDYQGTRGDIAVRRFSILLSILQEQLPESEGANLLNACRHGDSATVQELLDRYQVPDAARNMLLGAVTDARACLGSLSNLGLKLALHEILGKLFKEHI